MCAMYSNPELYERTNVMHFRDAKGLFEKIEYDWKKNKFPMETVLDVGCGTGNITEYFFERFKPCRLVGFDLSTDMVNFARAHHMVKEPEKTAESMEIDETKMDGKQNASDLKKNSKLPGSSSKGNISKAKDGKATGFLPATLRRFEVLTSFFSNWRKNRKQPVEVNKKKTIEYHQGDVGEPFEELSTKLGLAEGSVDVIISVYCIHWVPDTRQAIKNISRFLRPGGKFYLLISTWSEFFVSEQEILNNIKWRDMLLSGLAIVQKGERPLLHESDVAASLDRFTDRPKEAGARRRYTRPDVMQRPSEEFLHHFWTSMCHSETLDLERIQFTFAHFPIKEEKDFLDQCHAACYWLNYLPKEHHADFLADYSRIIQNYYIKEQVEKHDSFRKIFKGTPILDEINPWMNLEPDGPYLFRFNYNYATMIGEKPHPFVGNE